MCWALVQLDDSNQRQTAQPDEHCTTQRPDVHLHACAKINQPTQICIDRHLGSVGRGVGSGQVPRQVVSRHRVRHRRSQASAIKTMSSRMRSKYVTLTSTRLIHSMV